MIQNTSSALYCCTAAIRGKQTGLSCLFRVLLKEEECLETSALPMPCGWRETKESTITALALILDLEPIPNLPQKLQGPSAGY